VKYIELEILRFIYPPEDQLQPIIGEHNVCELLFSRISFMTHKPPRETFAYILFHR
jgi:hypothetical protein